MDSITYYIISSIAIDSAISLHSAGYLATIITARPPPSLVKRVTSLKSGRGVGVRRARDLHSTPVNLLRYFSLVSYFSISANTLGCLPILSSRTLTKWLSFFSFSDQAYTNIGGCRERFVRSLGDGR